jgi:hypothetical protein
LPQRHDQRANRFGFVEAGDDGVAVHGVTLFQLP